jgi:hypothetical protein
MGRVAAALSSGCRAINSPSTHAAWHSGTSFLFCFRRDSWDAASTSETYGPGTLPDRSSLGIESETTQTDIGLRRPAGSALLTRGSRLRVGRANPTNSGLFHRMCACWKRHIACKLPHENGERVVMFQRAGTGRSNVKWGIAIVSIESTEPSPVRGRASTRTMFPPAPSMERDDIGSKRRGGVVRDKLGAAAQSAINFEIVVRHAPGRKALLETSPHHAPIKSGHLGRRMDRLVHCVHNPPSEAIVDDLRHRAAAKT